MRRDAPASEWRQAFRFLHDLPSEASGDCPEAIRLFFLLILLFSKVPPSGFPQYFPTHRHVGMTFVPIVLKPLLIDFSKSLLGILQEVVKCEDVPVSIRNNRTTEHVIAGLLPLNLQGQ
jgi:hypothetical protein